MRVLHERGLRVPWDVAVVGFDDIEEGRFGAVTLTTISPDKQAIARLAVALPVCAACRAGPEPRRIRELTARFPDPLERREHRPRRAGRLTRFRTRRLYRLLPTM